MYNVRENREMRQQEPGVVAVAVDKEKSSQFALKWAIDNLFPRSRLLQLVHVVQRSPSPSSKRGVAGNSDIVTQQEPDPQAMEVLLPYRCFCARRQVQFEIVILHDPCVSRALTDYVSLGGVDTMVLGTLSRKGLSRIFRNSDVSSSVLKWASNFCNVYVIYKGKVSAMRHASRSAQTNHAVERTQSSYDQNVNHHADPDILYDELSVVENDNSLSCSGRLSTDSNCLSFYEHLESGLVGSSSGILNLDNGNIEPSISSFKTVNQDTMNDFSFSEGSSFSLEDMEVEVRRHKVEVKEAMDLYHAVCREARITKKKLIELEDWKMKQEQRMKEIDSENARSKAALEGAQRLADEEEEKRVLQAELKAMIEASERQKILDALRQSHTIIRYQTLFNIFVVMVLSYFFISSSN